MPAVPAWLASVEALLNRGLQGSLQATTLARRLEATAIRVDIAGLTSMRVSVSGGRLDLVPGSPSPEAIASGAVDATISGSPFALLQLARGGSGSGRRGSQPSAQVRGDAEIASLYRELFALVRPDLEEELSRIVGDPAARRLSQLANRAVVWMRKTRATAGENIAEYLQEESRALVNRPELEEFLRAVDTVRETADRVEARIARLERQLKSSP